jgi:MYXO-CTERM domain-containing protein
MNKMNKESAYASRESVPAMLYEPQILLAFMPPSQRHRRMAFASVLVLFVVFVITAPFISTPLTQIKTFIPIIETAVFICALITASLLFAQYAVSRSPELLALASGYLFTALIVIPHALTFPGAFAPMELLGAGSQSTAWLYIVWHCGFALFVIGYALLKDVARETGQYQGPAVRAIGSIVAMVIALVCGLTWVITTQESYLPRIIGADPSFRTTGIGNATGIGMLLLGALALALLWRRRRSVLDLWLIVVMFAFLFEVGRVAIGSAARFSLGFYASRIYSLITATTVLLVFLSETTALYARLAGSIIRQQREHESRQLAMDAMAASIAHEVKQPLATMVANANAGLRWLTKKAPDLDETRAALQGVVDAGHRAAEVIGSVRVMFKQDLHGRARFSVNDVVRDVLTMVDIDLWTQRVSVSTELREGLPQLLVDRGQLQQVFLNLIMNAIQAMRSVTDRARLLRIRSDNIQESAGVLVTIEDSGTGIAMKDTDRIFEPFFTTKSTGTGVGLAICRSIVEAHGGSLRASANNPHGTIFYVTLPTDFTGAMTRPKR